MAQGVKRARNLSDWGAPVNNWTDVHESAALTFLAEDNMRTYLISYDLKQPHRDYPRISKAIMAYGYYCKLLESTWIIRTGYTAAQVRDDLKNHVDANDRIAVVGLTNEWASWNLPGETASWLKQQLAA